MTDSPIRRAAGVGRTRINPQPEPPGSTINPQPEPPGTAINPQPEPPGILATRRFQIVLAVALGIALAGVVVELRRLRSGR